MYDSKISMTPYFCGRNYVIGWEKGKTTPTYRSHRCPPTHMPTSA